MLGRHNLCPVEMLGRHNFCPVEMLGRHNFCPVEMLGRHNFCPVEMLGRHNLCPVEMLGRHNLCLLGKWQEFQYHFLLDLLVFYDVGLSYVTLVMFLGSQQALNVKQAGPRIKASRLIQIQICRACHPW